MEQSHELVDPSTAVGESFAAEGMGPQGELENQIAQVWRDAFRVEQIRRDDNFFELGGNSVLGMAILEALGTRFSIQLPVVALFQFPTIRTLAEYLSEPIDTE